MARPDATATRRREILEATCKVLAVRGFHDLRIVDVARQAGISTGTIHYYFDGKDELLQEAFRFQYESSVTHREAYFDTADDPLTRLRKMADGYLPGTEQTIENWRVWLELWVAALGDAVTQEINDHYYNDWRRVVIDAVVEARELGLVHVTDPTMFANAFVAMMDGLAIQVLAGSRHMDVERMRATCAAFVDTVSIQPRPSRGKPARRNARTSSRS